MSFLDINFSRADEYKFSIWEKEECCKYYVETRKENCTFLELLDLWLHVPYCEDCVASDPFRRNYDSDITPHNWQDDLVWNLGEETAREIKRENRSIQCKRCSRELVPEKDPIHVVPLHLEEHFGIPAGTEGKIEPPKKIRTQIFRLYERKCFNCKKSEAEIELHIDHIRPRSKGGDAAFRNLQPLCKICGKLKGNRVPTEVTVTSDIYFGPYPPETFEGLFW